MKKYPFNSVFNAFLLLFVFLIITAIGVTVSACKQFNTDPIEYVDIKARKTLDSNAKVTGNLLEFPCAYVKECYKVVPLNFDMTNMPDVWENSYLGQMDEEIEAQLPDAWYDTNVIILLSDDNIYQLFINDSLEGEFSYNDTHKGATKVIAVP